MWSEEKIEAYIKDRLEPSRFNHVLGVRDSAVTLAKHYGEDEEKAKLAALIHDCAKNMNDNEILDLVKAKGIKIDRVFKWNPQLLHGLAAGIIAKSAMRIKDEEIFNAVRYHTTGRRKMNLLEKIIYLADYIEPGRDFPGVDDLRKVAFEDIDKAMLMALDNTIKYVISKRELLHTDTIDARNYFISRK